MKSRLCKLIPMVISFVPLPIPTEYNTKVIVVLAVFNGAESSGDDLCPACCVKCYNSRFSTANVDN
jgi:hypothetical protein